MASFDDAVTTITYDLFSNSIFNKKNPDGCPIGVTHFLSHEYTDYSKVQDLWKRGHEIALHSVTYVKLNQNLNLFTNCSYIFLSRTGTMQKSMVIGGT